MPSFYNKPSIFGNATVEDVNRLNQLPFYLVKNEVKTYAEWNVFDQMYGTIPWQDNMGPVMKGVTPQRSPVGRSFFFPNAIQTVANKDVYQVTESVEQAGVLAHKYESFQFNFLPSFQIFWETYLKFANTDIVRQIQCSNNQFIETNMWFNASNVYLCGYGIITGCPTAMGNDAGTAANSKTAAWLIGVTMGIGGNPGVLQNLTLRDAFRCVMAISEDFAAPRFDGVKNMPKDNEGVKDKYVIVTSAEGYLNWTFDKSVAELKSINLDLLFNDFKGMLFGTTTTKITRYPIRYNVIDLKDINGNVMYPAGTPIDPEVFDLISNKWLPNPYYTSLVSAPFEINWILGADYAKTIKVGPPPKEFAAKRMDGQKFYSMKWNGEVQITDQVLITNPDGSQELNIYGENLKYISKLTHGYLVGERRYAFPILVKRVRPNAIVA